jgi:hypothetical protein
MTSELARQPWLIHGLMRTAAGASPRVVGGNVWFTLLEFYGHVRGSLHPVALPDLSLILLRRIGVVQQLPVKIKMQMSWRQRAGHSIKQTARADSSWTVADAWCRKPSAQHLGWTAESIRTPAGT